MNKVEFINKLNKKLKYLPNEDREDAVAYYREYLEDMGVSDTDDVTNKIGNPSEIAATIIAECTEKIIEDNKTNKKVKNSTKIVWLVIITILSMPILIPLAIVLVSVLLSVLLVAFCLMVSAIIAAVLIFVVSGIGQKLVSLGIAFILMAIGLLLVIGSIELSRLFIILIIKLVKVIGKKENK